MSEVKLFSKKLLEKIQEKEQNNDEVIFKEDIESVLKKIGFKGGNEGIEEFIKLIEGEISTFREDIDKYNILEAENTNKGQLNPNIIYIHTRNSLIVKLKFLKELVEPSNVIKINDTIYGYQYKLFNLNNIRDLIEFLADTDKYMDYVNQQVGGKTRKSRKQVRKSRKSRKQVRKSRKSRKSRKVVRKSRKSRKQVRRNHK